MTPTSSNPSATLQHELGKRNPFENAEQEAHLNLVRTASVLNGDFERLFDAHGLSGSSFNILRILRGALNAERGALTAGRGSLTGGNDVRAAGHGYGKPCHEIGEQMVARVPDVTRLVDRLEKMGLVERSRGTEDRRVVYVGITQAGLDLLRKLDEPVLELHRAQLGHMSKRDLEELSRLLTLARAGKAEGAAVSPDEEGAGGNPGTARVVNRGPRSRHSSKDRMSDQTSERSTGSHAHTPARGRPRRPGSAGTS